ncbi:hypothetical protein LR48_Vigan01g313100 [Vigna angularis]|uniref:Protein DMP2-like protein n=2 Tax=Phaseolus angularis TaxID=3914 RepID=A0A0L9TSR1_PHAAN|nr:protein DMP2 [Vigna angularis]KAG2407162.1 Protein DMP2-like protein [Vigna angularis]KOM33575.1 hypothetical protein LR48_Vigan01g313100 [Vigna angularis]BAT77207.1 hypothetical protein VIGAN_01530300 [Vigna angularis var. angularis]
MTSRTLLSVGSLIKLLPTGTFFVFQFLNPALTNNGKCNGNKKSLCAILLGLCGISCFFSSFTDSYTGNDGNRHYGLVTPYGIFPSPASDNIDLSRYKLKFGDMVHAFLSVIVFAVLGLLDTNTVNCFYPGSSHRFLQLLPIAIGLVAGELFMIFPNDRHGYGYPLTSDSNDNAPPNNPVAMPNP